MALFLLFAHPLCQFLDRMISIDQDLGNLFARRNFIDVKTAEPICGRRHHAPFDRGQSEDGEGKSGLINCTKKGKMTIEKNGVNGYNLF